MFERMLNKRDTPSSAEIREYIGEAGFERLCALEERLSEQYDLAKDLRFPFGNRYGWGYKYSHKSFHLCYAFFEKSAVTITIQVGDKQVPTLEAGLEKLSPRARELWANRYPCGDTGGWVHYRMPHDGDLADIMAFVHAKKAPLPRN